MNLKIDSKKCSGCGVCRLACSIENFGRVAPSNALLRIEGLFPDPGIYQIHMCDQCGDCADSCPVEAIELVDGIYKIDEDECTACHACVEACPHSVMIIKKNDEMPAKCVLCRECAHTCPREAITVPKETEIGKEVAK